MLSENVVATFGLFRQNESFGKLRLYAGVSVVLTLLYWLRVKRCGSSADESQKNQIKIGNRDIELAGPNAVPDVVGSEWIQIGLIEQLYYYPLKSGRGKPIDHCDFTEFGISCGVDGFVTLKDRMFLVYSGKTGKFQTGRNYAKLVLVSLDAVDELSVRLEANGMPDLVFQVPETVDKTSVDEVACSMWWGETLRCIDCGSAAATWISKFLTGNEDSGLRIGAALPKRRNILKGPWKKFTKVYTNLRNEDTGYFSDIASYMLMNESSVGELDKRLKRNVSMLQFRPNIVVSGCSPFAEDSWEWIKIGENVVLRNVKPCPRCAMIRINPDTAEVDSLEPLNTLRSFREQTDPKRVEVDGKAPTLGIYCGLYKTGAVNIGDRVFVIPFASNVDN